MKAMTIRDVPEELHAALKERARRNRRSLNQQVIEDLSQLVAGEAAMEEEERKRRRPEELIGMVKEFRRGATGFMTAEEIDAAMEEGRG
ncbi:MAG: FitA-like ribbon-helix-helix domain-containing protein [Opitutales bacterium]